MTTVAPPPPPPPTPPPQRPPPPPVLVVPEPPVALTRLAIGARLDAQVAAPTPEGLVRITTALGTLDVQPPAPLPRDALLLLAVQATSPRVQLQLLALDGQPPSLALRADPAAQPSPPGQPAPQPAVSVAKAPGAAGAAASPGQPPLAVGASVEAVVVRPAGAAGPAAFTAPAATTSGQAAPLGKPTPAAPLAAAATAGKAPAPGTPAASTPPSPATPAQAAARGPAPAAGTQVSVRLAAIHPPGQGPPVPDGPPTQALAAGRVVSGTVIGTSATAQPLVRTPVGLVTLQTNATLPRGATVDLEVLAPARPPEIPAAAPRPAAAPLTRDVVLRAPDWPGLREAVQVLAEADPAVARHLAETVLPRAEGRLTATMLFFLSALRAGDVRGWVGEPAARVLQRVRPDVLARISEDFTQLSRIAEEPARGDWRVAQIPLYTGTEIEQIRLFMRHHRADDEDEEGAAKGSRFILDVTLSRLGRMQLDGLVRGGGKHLDLVVRSERPLADTMREDIRTIFRDAAELTGLSGGIGFQAAPPGFVDVTAGPEPGDAPDLLV